MGTTADAVTSTFSKTAAKQPQYKTHLKQTIAVVGVIVNLDGYYSSNKYYPKH
jgi:hypothetical protein